MSNNHLSAVKGPVALLYSSLDSIQRRPSETEQDYWGRVEDRLDLLEKEEEKLKSCASLEETGESPCLTEFFAESAQMTRQKESVTSDVSDAVLQKLNEATSAGGTTDSNPHTSHRINHSTIFSTTVTEHESADRPRPPSHCSISDKNALSPPYDFQQTSLYTSETISEDVEDLAFRSRHPLYQCDSSYAILSPHHSSPMKSKTHLKPRNHRNGVNYVLPSPGHLCPMKYRRSLVSRHTPRVRALGRGACSAKWKRQPLDIIAARGTPSRK